MGSHKVSIIVWVVLFTTTISSCSIINSSSNSSQLISKLAGDGEIAITSENPYLASNQLLSLVSRESSEVKGFIDLEGRPKSLVVEKNFFGGATLNLYYPDKNHYFTARQNSSGWILNGPFPIARSGSLNNIYAAKEDLENGEIGYKESPLPDYEVEVVKDERLSRIQKRGFISPEKIDSASRASASHSSDLKARMSSTLTATLLGKAERSPGGDIIHYVVSTKEKLSQIADWYTKDKTNSERLARINGIKDLNPGDQIVIPSYLVREEARMPD
jgi:hypothetical protein